MKRLIVLLFVACLFSQGSLWAADAPKAEIFAGFSALTIKSGSGRVTPKGWQGSIAGSLSNMLSLVGDFGGQYKDGAHSYEYMGGVQISGRGEKSTLFVHALAGAATGGGKVAGIQQPTETAFMLGFGGGLDIKVAEKYAIRAIQFDWIPSKPNTGWATNQLRFGFGVVHLSN